MCARPLGIRLIDQRFGFVGIQDGELLFCRGQGSLRGGDGCPRLRIAKTKVAALRGITIYRLTYDRARRDLGLVAHWSTHLRTSLQAWLRYGIAEDRPRMSSKRTKRGWPRPPH